MPNNPVFSDKTELTRYIDEVQRLSDNRPAFGAFLSNPGDTYLSVNYLHIEEINQIVRYYRKELQRDDQEVAICIHKVAKYNDAGRKAGVSISFDRRASRWEYRTSYGTRAAYKHRPVPSHGNRLGSPSHCGVEFVEVLDELSARKFARQMAKNRFHVF